MKLKTKTIYIAGAGGIGNIGAEATLLAIIKLLQEKYKGARFLIASWNPERIKNILSEIDGEFKIIKKSPFPNPLEILRADLFVICGDLAIAESVLALYPIYWAVRTLTAKALFKKVIFLGIEAEKIKRPLNIYALKYVLHKTTDYFILRNGESFINLKNIFQCDHSLLTGCEPTLTLKEKDLNNFDYNNIQSSSKLVVGFGVRDFFTTPLKINFSKMKLEKQDALEGNISEEMKKIISFTARIIDYLTDKYDARIIFIPHHFMEEEKKVILSDAEVAELIIKQIKNKADVLVVESNLHPFAVINIYKKLDIALSMRHHSNAFAYLQGVPTLGYAISEKMTNYYRHIEKEKMLINPFDSDLSKTNKLLDYIIANRKTISGEMSAGLKASIRDMEQALDIALNGR